MMRTTPSIQLPRLQRLRVELESHEPERTVKIRLEGFDEKLGWYSAGSLTIALHQVPLLEQALEHLRMGNRCDQEAGATIIPFPSLAEISAG